MFRSNHPEFRLLEHPRHERVFGLKQVGMFADAELRNSDS